MIERISQRLGNDFGPGVEFFARRRVAGAKPFGNARRTHRAPFVVVAFEPDFPQIGKLPITRDVARRQMVVIIENRLVFGVFVKKTARGVALQEEIGMDEGHDEEIISAQRIHSPQENEVRLCGLMQVFPDICAPEPAKAGLPKPKTPQLAPTAREFSLDD